MAGNPTISQIKVGNTTYDISDSNANTLVSNNFNIIDPELTNYYEETTTTHWGKGIYFYNDPAIVNENIQFDIIGTDLNNGNKGGTIEAKRWDADNNTMKANTLRLLLDSDGNNVVWVSSPAAWRTALGFPFSEITVSPSSAVTINQVYNATDSTKKVVPLAQKHNVGSDLSISGGKIKCAKNGYIEVSGSIIINNATAGNSVYFELTAEGREIIADSNVAADVRNRANLHITPRLFYAHANDLIICRIYNYSSATGVNLTDENACYITVRYVNW